MDSNTNYKIPKGTGIGHVHLKVAEIQRSLDFYCGLLGFELTTTYGDDAVFISAGGYHHHIGLNVWFSKNAPPAPRNSAGLFHTAILYPTRKDLAVILHRIQQAGYPLTGASDHGVSEALYLDSALPKIDIEVAKIKDIWANNSKDRDTSFATFSQCHVRGTIGEPHLRIPLQKLKELLNTNEIGSLKMKGRFVENGVGIQTENSSFYGILEGDTITQFCISNYGDKSLEEILKITKSFNLIFVNWYHADVRH